MARGISKERKAAYYGGAALMIVGGLLFASTFLTFISMFAGGFDAMSNVQSLMLQALVGMALIVVGGMVRRVGALGLAGSGVVLDTEQARQELEPYGRMAGGVLKDVLDEADVHLGARPTEVVKIRCRACGKLNEDDSKFCQEGGTEI